ncbi:MAG: hypothetical protein WCD11_09535, partial [Solirubrobacteraceae bacterium]
MTRAAVAAATDGQLDATLPRKRDHSRHVLCVGYARDSERVAIDALEENRSCVVVAGIVERDQLAGELRPEIVDLDVL